MIKNTFGLAAVMETRALQFGEGAAQVGRAKSENPYVPGSRRWSDWNLGWQMARRQAAANENGAVARQAVDQSPFDLGFAAGQAGQGAGANPYHMGHPGHEPWRLGWAKARATA